jgi:cobalt-zinc-cadmium resistance protein CzcA
MIRRLIDFHLDNPWLVLFGLAALVIVGLRSLFSVPIDAFPDLTNNQVVVVTEAPGMAVVEVEELVTFPIESAMMGLPDTLEVRSISKLGLSMVTIVFEDHVNTYFARQVATERLNDARGRIPAGLEPTLGPVATAFGEVYQYTVEGEGFSPMDLKTLHEWEIKYQLRAIPGVADINTWGGLSRQYEIQAEPAKLRSYGLTLRDIFERVRDNNTNFSGGFVEHHSEQYTVRGLGRTTTAEELGNVVLDSHRGTPVYLRDVAEVQVGAAPRQGAVTRDGEGETVSGMVIMLKGQNSKTVIERVKAAVEAMKSSLPDGVRIVPFYDQSFVIDGTIRTVRDNLLKGGGLVILILLISLGQFRAALIVAAVIPLSLLAAFFGMEVFGVTANLMSLGAVDFGMVVDGPVILVENYVRHLQERQRAAGQGSSVIDYLREVRDASHQVSGPVLAGMAVIIAVYIPILTLQGLEGRMYRPMAITVCCAILGSLILTLTVLPTACRFLLRGQTIRQKEPLFDPLRKVYLGALDHVLNHRVLAVIAAVAIVGLALGSLAFIGTEFMPRLDEGTVLVQTLKLPSISLSESIDMELEVERVLLEFPEVNSVVSKLGRPDFATEAMGVYEADVYVDLKPHEEWTTADTKEDLITAMAQKLQSVPGVVYNFTQPMAMRLDETVSGVRADVAVKIFGDDERILERKADEVLRWLSQVRGAADTQREVFSGAAEWQVRIKRDQLARYGLNVTDVEDLVESAVGGKFVTELIDGRRRFRVVVRLPKEYRDGREQIGALLLPAPGGELVPLSEVADIVESSGPEVVNREHSQRRIVVQCNVRGRDIGSFVGEAQQVIEQNVDFPVGYFIRWGGQFEHQESAMRRLSVLLPIVVGVIFFVLYTTFGSFRQSFLVLLLVPFATVGGVAALWLRDMNLNVSASIGFIAVFGVAITDGLVLVSAINHIRQEGVPIREALMRAAGLRLRPVVMTSVVAALGFLPMAVATSIGAEVQRPLATVVIGGLCSSTLLTLFMIPVLFPWFEGRKAAERA